MLLLLPVVTVCVAVVAAVVLATMVALAILVRFVPQLNASARRPSGESGVGLSGWPG